MKKIIIIRGPLGVGKSTVAKNLAKRINANYLSIDDILDKNNLVEEDGSLSLESFLQANEIIHKIANESENTFVVDGNFYYQEQIDDLRQKFKDAVEIFSLLSTIEKCLERDKGREKVYGEDSTRYVYEITTKIKIGHEIDNTNLSVEGTVEKIMDRI